jgi:hypothetical protein
MADKNKKPQSSTRNTDGARQADRDTRVDRDTSVGGRTAGGNTGSGGVSTTDVGGQVNTDIDNIDTDVETPRKSRGADRENSRQDEDMDR